MKSIELHIFAFFFGMLVASKICNNTICNFVSTLYHSAIDLGQVMQELCIPHYGNSCATVLFLQEGGED